MPLTTELRDFFPAAHVLGLDIETTGLDPWSDQITAITVSDGQTSYVVDVRRKTPALVALWLVTTIYTREVVVHNGQFDLSFLRRVYGVGYPATVYDTLLGEALLVAGLYDDGSEEDDDEDGPASRRGQPLSRSLQATAKRRLGMSLDKDMRLRLGFTAAGEWGADLIAYAEADAQVLLRLRQAQRRALAEEGMERVAKIEMKALPVFCEMYLRGVIVDVERLRPLISAAQQAADAAKEHLQRLLTPYIWYQRKRDNAAEEARLSAWGQRYAAAEALFRTEWNAHIAGTADAEPWVFAWSGVTIPGSSKAITNEEVESWYDQTVPKGKAEPAGQRRFVKRMMQHWRTEPGNERPAIKVESLVEPINVNSREQKLDAVALYLREVNQRDGTSFPPLPDLRKTTLMTAAATAPPRVREELILPLQTWGKNEKLCNTFGEPLERRLHADGSLHGGWNQTGTATGRPSCSAPNLLNLPKDQRYRAAFRAREGHRLIVADYSQMEYRELAEFSQDPELLRAYREGLDLHALTAAAIYDVPLVEVTEQQRGTAKVVNFGTSYGMRQRALHRNLAGWGIFVSLDEARHYLDAWDTQFPVARRYLTQQGRRGVAKGYAVTALGRRRHFAVSPAADKWELAKMEREAANHVIQGANADVTKLAMGLIQPMLEPLGGSIILQVYDEIVCEVAAEHAATAQEIVSTCMQLAGETILRSVPCAVSCVISPSWSKLEAEAPA